MSLIKYGPCSLDRADPDTLDTDPRGILWSWAPPSLKHSYVIGCDPTVGIQGWNRSVRTTDDAKVDNAAVEVFRVGRGGLPDEQVAEYAAPIAPLTLAPLLNALGRLYAGNSESGEAKMIVEVYPGPGLAVMQELVHKYAYTNFWFWQHPDKFIPTPTQYPGWYASSRTAQQMLWTKGHHYIAQGGVRFRSPWLVEEMADAVIDPVKMRAAATWGAHDDRMYATLMALYAIHDWASMEIPDAPHADETPKLGDYQSQAITVESMWNDADDKVSAWLDEV